MIIAAYTGVNDPTEPTEVYIHHRAGLLGQGGSSYIDALILRDRDTDGGSPHTLDERRYFCQNWRGDVIAILADTGHQVESVRYSPYGVPHLLVV